MTRFTLTEAAKVQTLPYLFAGCATAAHQTRPRPASAHPRPWYPKALMKAERWLWPRVRPACSVRISGRTLSSINPCSVQQMILLISLKSNPGRLRPYIELFLEEVQKGTIEPFPKGPYLAGLEPTPNPVFAPFQKDLFTPKPQEKAPAEQALIDQLIAATKSSMTRARQSRHCSPSRSLYESSRRLMQCCSTSRSRA